MIAAATLIPIHWALFSVAFLFFVIFVMSCALRGSQFDIAAMHNEIDRLTDEIKTLKASREHARATIEKINAKHAEFVKSKEQKA